MFQHRELVLVLILDIDITLLDAPVTPNFKLAHVVGQA